MSKNGAKYRTQPSEKLDEKRKTEKIQNIIFFEKWSPLRTTTCNTIENKTCCVSARVIGRRCPRTELHGNTIERPAVSVL